MDSNNPHDQLNDDFVFPLSPIQLMEIYYIERQQYLDQAMQMLVDHTLEEILKDNELKHNLDAILINLDSKNTSKQYQMVGITQSEITKSQKLREKGIHTIRELIENPAIAFGNKEGKFILKVKVELYDKCGLFVNGEDDKAKRKVRREFFRQYALGEAQES